MNIETFVFAGCLASLVFLAVMFLLKWRQARGEARGLTEKVDQLQNRLGRCQVRAGNLDEECRRLAWATHDQLKSLKKDLESRSGYFERQRDSTPHKDHEQRALGYREASATMGRMMEEMVKRGGGRQKVKVDL